MSQKTARTAPKRRRGAQHSKPEQLTEKQRRFVECYMGKCAGNGTAAARAAGYKGNTVTLAAVATENLRKPLIQQAIQARIAKAPEVATREELQAFWSAVLRGNPKLQATILERLRASELLGKTMRMFVERVDVHMFDHAAHLAKLEAGE